LTGRVLTALKPTAVVINLGRSNLIDHAALVTVLRAGEIAGAALRV
jgi:phosphoglycerate dehydrogenase-like enzyme